MACICPGSMAASTRVGTMQGIPPPSSHLLHCWTHLSYVPNPHICAHYEEKGHIRRPCSQSSTNSETGGYSRSRPFQTGNVDGRNLWAGRRLSYRIIGTFCSKQSQTDRKDKKHLSGHPAGRLRP